MVQEGADQRDGTAFRCESDFPSGRHLHSHSLNAVAEHYATDVDYSLAFDLGVMLGIFAVRPKSPISAPSAASSTSHAIGNKAIGGAEPMQIDSTAAGEEQEVIEIDDSDDGLMDTMTSVPRSAYSLFKA